jgi:hypothetical protein
MVLVWSEAWSAEGEKEITVSKHTPANARVPAVLLLLVAGGL